MFYWGKMIIPMTPSNSLIEFPIPSKRSYPVHRKLFNGLHNCNTKKGKQRTSHKGKEATSFYSFTQGTDLELIHAGN